MSLTVLRNNGGLYSGVTCRSQTKSSFFTSDPSITSSKVKSFPQTHVSVSLTHTVLFLPSVYPVHARYQECSAPSHKYTPYHIPSHIPSHFLSCQFLCLCTLSFISHWSSRVQFDVSQLLSELLPQVSQSACQTCPHLSGICHLPLVLIVPLPIV